MNEVGESSFNGNVEFDLNPRLPEVDKKVGSVKDTISIFVDENDSTKTLQIGSRLSPALRASLVHFLKSNLDIFAWSHAGMVGIEPEIICHHLNIDQLRKRVRQRCRAFSGDRVTALKEDVDRLLKVGLGKESFYPDWLAYPVLVRNIMGSR